MQLAQINIGKLRHPLTDLRVADFVNNLDAVNALAEASDGFIWRLKDDSGNATQISAYDDPTIIMNMSVWQSVEALEAFAYGTMHRRFVQRRKEWFELLAGAYVTMWWVDEGVIPSVDEGQRRLAHFERFGPTAYAFSFKRRFPPGPAVPIDDIGDVGTSSEPYRSCG